MTGFARLAGAEERLEILVRLSGVGPQGSSGNCSSIIVANVPLKPPGGFENLP